MKSIKYCLLSLVLISIANLFSMQASQINNKAIDACMTQVSSVPVNNNVISNASFNDNNQFRIGELVITPNSSYTQYFYSCVVGIHYNMTAGTPLLKISVKRETPFGLDSVSFHASDVGKLKTEKLP